MYYVLVSLVVRLGSVLGVAGIFHIDGTTSLWLLGLVTGSMDCLCHSHCEFSCRLREARKYMNNNLVSKTVRMVDGVTWTRWEGIQFVFEGRIQEPTRLCEVAWYLSRSTGYLVEAGEKLRKPRFIALFFPSWATNFEPLPALGNPVKWARGCLNYHMSLSCSAKSLAVPRSEDTKVRNDPGLRVALDFRIKSSIIYHFHAERSH
jgi:hypothetical protein